MTQNTNEIPLLNVTVSPHIKAPRTTSSIMLDVIIALIPASVAACVLFGIRALLLLATAIISCILSELLFNKIVKKPCTIPDLSAVVTAIILALNVPVTLPLWQLAFGSVAAICMVKGLFGGLGQNFANPAITARILLFVAFPSAMSELSHSNFCSLHTNSSGELLSSATPLSVLMKGDSPYSLLDMLFGNHTTSAVGETCVIAILIGFIYLLIRRVITPHIPVCFVGTVFLLTLINTQDAEKSLYLIFSGGLLFGAVFMATDYATTPTSKLGRAVFGVGCGLITFVIRTYGSYPEGVSLAILLMNLLTPYIEQLCRAKPFGAGGKKQ